MTISAGERKDHHHIHLAIIIDIIYTGLDVIKIHEI